MIRTARPGSDIVLLTGSDRAARADVKLPANFGIHMALQRGQKDRVWGWSDPGEDVTFTIDGQTKTAKAGEDGKWIVTLDHVGGGLRKFDIPEPRAFAIAASGRKFVWAKAKLVARDKVEVWSDEVSDPVAVRYAWADNPVCNLYSQEGLPVTPFRTDDWPGVMAESK